MVRLKDVARHSGVGAATVSRVINGTKFVSPDVRERVLTSLNELNYVGNAQAKQLATGVSDFIGLIVSDIENPFLPAVIKTFEASAKASGFDVLMAATNYDDVQTERALRTMLRHRVRAVAILTSQISPSFAALLDTQGIPSVFLNGTGTGPNRSVVRLDLDTGVSAAVTYLYNVGHRAVTIIAGPQDRTSHIAYLDAALGACSALSLEAEYITEANTVEGGERALSRLLHEGRLPTSIMCGNDLAAIGALRALTSAGVHVPGDVSLIGADDIGFAELTNPPLTTIRIPRSELGRAAFRVLENNLRKSGEVVDERLSTELIVRGSACQVRPHGLRR